MAKEPPNLDDMLTMDEAAAKLGITRGAFYKRVYRTNIPVYKQGRLWLFDPKDLVASFEYVNPKAKPK